jgi:chemotaxis protein methyltransferase CheR
MISRLQKYVGENKVYKNYEEYYEELSKGKDHDLITDFVNILTTNFSYFFREKLHFNFLQYFLKNKIEGKNYIRIWSAACSTGEEPYSIAITCRENVGNIDMLDFKILATDISTKVLIEAEKGTYDLGKVEKSLTKMNILNNFKTDKKDNTITASDKIKKMIAFRQLNLLNPYPFNKNFDLVFLRNVLIYFNKNEKEIILNRIYDYIKPDGYLVIGLSESLLGMKTGFKVIKYSIYKK